MNVKTTIATARVENGVLVQSGSVENPRIHFCPDDESAFKYLAFELGINAGKIAQKIVDEKTAKAGKERGEGTSITPRFTAVSDLPEWTVWDSQEKRDLFPTKSGNRLFACKMWHEDIAVMIANALNAYIATESGEAGER